MVSVKNLANCDENYEYEKVFFLNIERHFYRSKVNTAKNVIGKKNNCEPSSVWTTTPTDLEDSWADISNTHSTLFNKNGHGQVITYSITIY